ADALPVYRVHYDGGCGGTHDELVLGKAWYQRVLTQGSQPVNEVQWPALQGETTLVIEALDKGCPFQGHLSPTHVDAVGNAGPFVTVEEVRAAAPHGELYFNGQHD